MFVIPVTINGSAVLSSTSTATISYTDKIYLLKKWYDNKTLALKVDIKTHSTTTTSADSGQLSVYPAIAETSGGTYVTFINGNTGTSMVLTGGTSITGSAGNGSYYIPLSIVVASGVTEALRNVPYIRFGHRSFQETRPWQAFLCVG